MWAVIIAVLFLLSLLCIRFLTGRLMRFEFIQTLAGGSTRVVGCFPDGESALMLVCARLRHVAGTQWGNKKYMNMKHLETMDDIGSLAG